MISKKTLHFIQLSVIFLLVTTLGLAANWGHIQEMRSQSEMMGMTMGDMMAVMHGSNLTFADMLWPDEGMVSQVSMTAHHERGRDFISISHYWSTAMIIILLPFILAGSVFLAISWLK